MEKEKKKYSILQVTPRFSPKHGGGGLVITAQLSKALAKQGHDITIYSSNYQQDDKYLQEFKGIRVELFKSLLNLSTFHFTLGMHKQVKQDLKEGKFDVIHLHSYRAFQNAVVCHYARKYNVPYILEAHGMTPGFGNPLIRFLKWGIDVSFGFTLLKGASLCIAETPTGIQEYIDYGVSKDNIIEISPPRDLDEFNHLPKKGLFKQKRNIKAKHMILFLGGIVHIKGVDFLVKGFIEFLKKEPDSVLVIAGPDQGLKAELDTLAKEAGITENIYYTGFISGEDKMEMVVDATMMVMPSRQEQGLPFSGLEALMCDVPLVVSDHTGAGDDVKKMKGGYLVTFDDVKGLSTIMEDIVQNPKEAQSITQKGKEFVEKNFSMKHKLKKYEDAYKSAIR